MAVLNATLDVVMSESTFNSVLVVFLSCLFASIFGISSAWIVTFSNIPFKKWIQWLLIMPLAIPPYVMAYVSKGFFDPFGTLDQWTGIHLDISNIVVLSLLISLVLYPYVYTPLRASLAQQSASLIEAAKIAGYRSQWKMMRLILPMHRTALVGGLLLVGLESLNEYGAPAYFGVKTYTTEIIRYWDPMNLQYSVSHALVALIFVGLLLYLESRTRLKSHTSDKLGRKVQDMEASMKSSLGFAVCITLLAIAFAAPVLQMLFWSGKNLGLFFESSFLMTTGYTFMLALSSGLILLLTSVLLSYFIYMFKNYSLAKLSFIANLGYAIPGAIIGIGVLIPIAWLNESTDILLTGTAGLLIGAYCMRYQSVAFNTVEGTLKKIPVSQLEASLSLGRSRIGSLRSVILPQMKPALMGALLLVFVDITKELPLTMLFQRFNQETLAVKAFIMMDTDGAFYKASVPSLAIVFLGVLSIIALRYLDSKDE
jgi:iron(III) transport system permease protein